MVYYNPFKTGERESPIQPNQPTSVFFVAQLEFYNGWLFGWFEPRRLFVQ